MLSGKLIHLIELHWDQIMTRVIDQIRREPEMRHIDAQVEGELRERGRMMLQNLGHWLSADHEHDLAEKYGVYGRLRFEHDVPLHESVQALCIMRRKILDFVDEHLFSKNTLELYAQEELERRLGRFFDVLTIQMISAYEHAMRRSLAASV